MQLYIFANLLISTTLIAIPHMHTHTHIATHIATQAHTDR